MVNGEWMDRGPSERRSGSDATMMAVAVMVMMAPDDDANDTDDADAADDDTSDEPCIVWGKTLHKAPDKMSGCLVQVQVHRMYSTVAQ